MLFQPFIDILILFFHSVPLARVGSCSVLYILDHERFTTSRWTLCQMAGSLLPFTEIGKTEMQQKAINFSTIWISVQPFSFNSEEKITVNKLDRKHSHKHIFDLYNKAMQHICIWIFIYTYIKNKIYFKPYFTHFLQCYLFCSEKRKTMFFSVCFFLVFFIFFLSMFIVFVHMYVRKRSQYMDFLSVHPAKQTLYVKYSNSSISDIAQWYSVECIKQGNQFFTTYKNQKLWLWAGIEGFSQYLWKSQLEIPCII